MSYTDGLDDPTKFFNTKLYTGNGTDNHAITGVGFAPDWVWQKTRDGASNHMIFDSVRGATKEIHSQNTDAELTVSTTLKSFDSDGFTLGTESNMNGSSSTKVAWNWLAGGTVSSNTDGDITSSVSHNSTSGFSIGTYTGTGTAGDTVGHGLNANPDVLIVKETNFSVIK